MANPDDPKPLNEAFKYLALGLFPIPLLGKKPCLCNWETRTFDPTELRDYWRWHPGANLGLRLGLAPGLVVVDIDPRNGGDVWETLHREALLQAGAAVVRTGGGGRHYYFRHPGGWVASGTNKIAPGVDMKADGGHQVVAPPSIHPETGAAYVWETPFTAADRDMLGVLPEWIAKSTAEAPPRAVGKNRGEAFGDFPADVLACRDRMRALAPAIEREGGDAATFRAACIGRDHDLSPDVFWPMLTEWNDTCQPPWDETDLRVKLRRAYLYAKAEKGGRGVSGLPEEPIIPGGENDPNAGPIRRGRPKKIGDANAEAEANGRVVAEEAEDEALAYTNEAVVTERGAWRDHVTNADLALSRDPRLARLFRFNDFTGRVELHGRAPWRKWLGTSEWGDDDAAALASWFTRSALPPGVQAPLTPGTWHQAVKPNARASSYHPVRDWFDSLTWDGTPRLDTAAGRLFGAPAGLSHVFFAKWMVSAVARVYRPGCKVDHMLVLEGKQGTRKSSVLRALAGDDWFTDADLDPHNKDTAQQLRGRLIVEAGELSAINRRDVETLKAWITRQDDRQRDPYERTVASWPRQCVFAGSTNRTDYIRDSTGGRRFWPVPCPAADVGAAVAERAQLWAEAIQRFEAGEQWWLNPAQELQAAELQAERAEVEAWAEPIEAWVGGRERFTTADVVEGALGRPRTAITSAELRRLADVLRRMGFEPARWREGTNPIRGYARACQRPVPDAVPDQNMGVSAPVPDEGKTVSGTLSGTVTTPDDPLF